MLKSTRRSVSRSITVATIVVASSSHAQVDANPPRPNVLLLVDSSGSMEYKTSTTTYPRCIPTGTGSETSRWIDLVQVLTGAIPNYRCETIARNTSRFQNEYKIAGAAPEDRLNPRDFLYSIPYHRPMSGNCAPTPGSNNDTVGFCYNTAAKPCSFSATDKCEFPKATGGLLDAFATELRFGLMTFDTLPDAGQDMVGTWSYIYGSKAMGAPVGCTVVADQEVGARNAAAPVWEGRMVAFGPPVTNNELDMMRTRNEKIQQILLATRPFGATPIAGMLHDAKNYFWHDPNPDGSGDVAPKDDPYRGCRDNYIILLTDGEPNMDLRPYCEGVNPVCGTGTDACCPFKKPEEIAATLANDPSRPVKTFVVGFAVSTATTDGGAPVACNKLTPTDLNSPTGICATNKSSSLKVCCTLSRIAYNGGTENAYFASNVEELRTSIATVLSAASHGTTSRTFPVFASATGSSAGATTFRFYTSFVPKIDGSGLWQGVIERQRFVCEGASLPKERAIDPSLGDSFSTNVNSSSPTDRRFFTVVGAVNGTAINSTRTIRANATSVTQADGVGTYNGSLVNGNTSTIAPNVPAAALGIAATPCISETGMTESSCRDRYLKWLVGGDNGTKYKRCPNPGAADCNLLGDIYHSVPAIVGSPRESLRDEGYQQFSVGPARKRPIVLYTSTNDGFLHAFKVASNDPGDTSAAARVQAKVNNELWAFIPPAVLPRIHTEYPNVHQLLLDGAPVVRDVPGTLVGSSGYVLERDLKTIAGPSSTWRTILVQSFGGAYPGYFALDVTDPVAGPKFLWQLTTDQAGNPLFGDSGGTPTITTLYFKPYGTSTPLELPVALLPGGNGGTPPLTTIDCDRADPNPSGFDNSTRPRAKVPCYTDDGATSNRAAARRARALTIVRLDTGEIIRSFRRSVSDAPASISGRITEVKLDSPITGQPVAYPGWTGAIADRAYVGDRDGTLWRLDLSSTDPTKWTMKLFFDAYTGLGSHAGQPIATTPLVSTADESDFAFNTSTSTSTLTSGGSGRVVVLFSTGSQDDLMGTANSVNFVYSLNEETADAFSTSVTPKVNWYLQFGGGQRVAGPLTLFSSNVYFSTYTPPANAHACDSGNSSLWGMHFVKRIDVGAPSKGGIGALPVNGDAASTSPPVQMLDADGTFLAKGSTIFGVGVARLQSCYATGDSITDPFFGTKYDPITASSAPQFQLVVQTGKAGTATAGAETKTATINLPQLNIAPRVNGWAMVTE